MTYYAHLDGNRIIGVLETDADPGPGYAVIAQPLDFSQRPSAAHKPHLIEGAVVWVDPHTLEDRKAARWAAIKAERDSREYGGFAWDGSTFDSDAESQRRLQGAAQLAVLAQAAQQPFEIAWTLADNSVRVLDAADMIQVGAALANHVAATHYAARALRQQIEAATTAAEVEAVAWP